MFEHLRQLFSNQFLSGGLGLMLSGAAMALLRNIPNRAWWWIKEQFGISMTIVDTDPLYEWIIDWLNEHPYSKKTRGLSVSTKPSDDNDYRSIDNSEVLFVPSYGNHILWWRRRPIWLNREKQNPTSGGSGESTAKSFRMPETVNLTIFGRNQQLGRQLVSDIVDCAREKASNRVSTYISTYGYWQKLSGFIPRKLSTIVLPPGVINSVVNDIRWFFDNRKWYAEMGIPYHRGYLLHGTPGTGKTSLIAALAGELRLNLYVLSLSGGNVNDEQLATLLMGTRTRSIILLEDVDAALPISKTRNPSNDNMHPPVPSESKDDNDSGVTLSGLLNCLDGILAKDGSLIFMTTNHKERLDPALIRPGRVDLQVEFTTAFVDEVIAMHRRFIPDAIDEDRIEFAIGCVPNDTMADVQNKLMEKVMGPKALGILVD